MVTHNPIIVALDLPTAEDAAKLAKEVAPHVGAFKVGLGLLHGPGPGTIDALVRLGLPVFADAKLHDIPSQVAMAAQRLALHGARWVTAHVGGGRTMLEAAVEGLAKGAGHAEAGILGVSVLTSLDKQDLQRIGIDRTPGQLVSKMASVAATAGCEGVVCSPLELHVVRQAAPDMITVVPGIRPEESQDDQSRTASPGDAIEKGATYLVVGRPITQAPNPAQAAESILAEVHAARSRG